MTSQCMETLLLKQFEYLHYTLPPSRTVSMVPSTGRGRLRPGLRPGHPSE